MNNPAALVDAVRSTVEVQLSELNTTMPGVVVSYDQGTNRAVVRPALAKRTADDSTIDPPAIHEVPVIWPSGANWSITGPLSAGDPVILHFAQRSIENWLNGSSEAPDDPRMFDLSDCVAYPGGKASTVGSDGLLLRFGSASIEIKDGTVSVNGMLVINGEQYTQHKHTGVQAGASLTGPKVG